MHDLDETRLAFSATEVAAMIGSTRGRVFRQIAKGALRARRNGNEILILRADLLEWLASLPRRSKEVDDDVHT